MKHYLIKHPWLYIVFVFLLLVSAWSGLIVIALTNQPSKVDFGAMRPGSEAIRE